MTMTVGELDSAFRKSVRDMMTLPFELKLVDSLQQAITNYKSYLIRTGMDRKQAEDFLIHVSNEVTVGLLDKTKES